MQTISESTPDCNTSVNDRRSHQCARPGWRPRRRSNRRMAQDIVASVLEHRALGHTKWIEPHEFARDPKLLALVEQLLAAHGQA